MSTKVRETNLSKYKVYKSQPANVQFDVPLGEEITILINDKIKTVNFKPYFPDKDNAAIDRCDKCLLNGIDICSKFFCTKARQDGQWCYLVESKPIITTQSTVVAATATTATTSKPAKRIIEC
jgi:hypothetical protein